MNEYEKEITKFLTEEENFKALINAKSHFELIKQELLENFWDEVESSIKRDLTDGWEMYPEHAIPGGTSKLSLRFNGIELEPVHKYPGLQLTFEDLRHRPVCGLWIYGWGNSVIYDYERFRQKYITLAQRVGNGYIENGDYYPVFKSMDIDFGTEINYVHILPQNRSEIVSQFVGEMLFLKDELEDVLKDFAENFKK